MLTCPHCLHTFEPPSVQDSATAASGLAPHCCATAAITTTPILFTPRSPCVRVFADSGGGLVLTSAEDKHSNPFIQPTLQLSFNQPTPSVQLSFVLPTTHSPWLPTITPPPPPHITPPPVFPPNPDTDLVRLSSTQKALRTSGWYYEGLSWQESATTLDHCAPGTFLVRDSSDPRFLFSLSVQTTRGPTSVRLHYVNGKFRLDSVENLAQYIPTFECVLRLVEYYVALGKRKFQQQQHLGDDGSTFSGKEGHVWVDLRGGHMHSPILLTRPKRRIVPSLQHLSRIAINQRLHQQRDITSLQLPPSVESYLRDYPYTQ